MSPKHFFYTEDHKGTSNLDSRTGSEAITVTPNLPGKPDCQELFLGITMDWSSAAPGEAWAAVDANELRDAIDKAVGKRDEEADWRDDDRVEVDRAGGRIVVGRETVGKYVGRWVFPSGLHYGDDAVANLNPKAVPASTAKPYRAVDRDRLLRHIEDTEAALARRNERHERDQERIRELEAEVFTLREIKDSYEEPKTAREYLELAWEAAIVPEDGEIHEGEAFLCKDESGIRQPVLGNAGHAIPVSACGVERRLMEPRVESTPEERRQALIEEHGLEDWELELLAGAAS